MIRLVLLGAGIGLTLGLARVRVEALIPALAIMWIGSWIALAEAGFWQVLLAVALDSMAVQAGFFCGLLARHVRTDLGFRTKPTAISISRR
jgi:uncharacterized membrane protein